VFSLEEAGEKKSSAARISSRWAGKVGDGLLQQAARHGRHVLHAQQVFLAG
jgi:hypothetical protein